MSEAYDASTPDEEVPEIDDRNKTAKFIRGGVSEVDYSLLKIIAVIADTAILAFIFSYALSIEWPLVVIVASGVSLASSIILTPLLLKSATLHIITALIISLTLAFTLFWFGGIPIIFAGVLAGLSLIMLIIGFLRAKKEINNSLRISFTQLSSKILPQALTVIALTTAIAYGFNFQADSLFTDKSTDRFIALSLPVFDYYFYDFTPEMTLKTLFIDIANRSLTAKDVSSYAVMTEELKADFRNQAVTEIYQNLENNFDIDLDLDESFEENLRSIFTTRIADAVETIPDHSLAIATTIIIFIALRGALWLIGWSIMGVTFFFYQLLLVTKFAEVYLETRRKEILLLK